MKGTNSSLSDSGSAVAANLLIVEDEPAYQGLIVQMLADQPYALTVVGDAEAAWQHLNAGDIRFDVVLLDLMLGDGDIFGGRTLLRQIKSDPRLRHTPVVLQTVHGASEDIAEGIRAGAYYYLVKPYSAALLLSILQTAAGDSRHFHDLLARVKQGQASLGLMNRAEFRFRDLNEARALATSIAGACPEPSRTILGLTEILINAVEHGNLAIGYDLKTELLESGRWEEEIQRRLSLPEYSERWARLLFVREGTEVRLMVEDQGDGFDWQKYLEIDARRAAASHGRGMALAKALSFDEVQYLDSGRRVEMRIHQSVPNA
ncbi:MAG: response regulator [Gammaproteobacteria bacterium]|nr:response regulator [Gammaproteobacteria bacterium]